MSALSRILWFLGAYCPVYLIVAITEILTYQAGDARQVWGRVPGWVPLVGVAYLMSAFVFSVALAWVVRRFERATYDFPVTIKGYELADMGVGDFILGASTLAGRFVAPTHTAQWGFLALFVVYGLVYVKLERLEMNPTLLFMQYRIYKVSLPTGEKVHMISRHMPTVNETVRTKQLSQFCYIVSHDQAGPL